MRKSTPVTCDVCGIQIARKGDLKRHKTLHSPDKEALMHSCPIAGCPYKTLQKSNIKCHMNTHTGSRPYKCVEDGCVFRSSDQGALTRHRKDIHGYVPKRRAGARTIRTREAVKPSTSSLTAGGLMLPAEALPDLYKTPAPELMQMLEPYPLLVPPTNCYTNTSVSMSGSALFPPDYFTQYSGTHNHQLPFLNTQSSSSSSPSLLASGLLMSEEARILDNKTLTNFYDVPFPTLPPPPNAVENNSVLSAGLYIDDPNYAIYNMPVASGSQFAGDYYTATSIPFGYESTANNTQSFNAQAFGNYPFTAPEMGFHQDVNQTYPYTMPASLGGCATQGTMYPSNQYFPFHS